MLRLWIRCNDSCEGGPPALWAEQVFSSIGELNDWRARWARDFETREAPPTITDLVVTPDLRHARVSYSVLGSADARRACGEALTRAAPFIRRELLRVTELRRAPELEVSDAP